MAAQQKSSVEMREEIQDYDTGATAKPVDTVHHDEALKVLETYRGDEQWSEDEERKLRRKLDWRLMPVLCVTYGLQYYDKAMLSQAVSLSCPIVLDSVDLTKIAIGPLWHSGGPGSASR